jgi:hypothetical protein
MKATFTEADDKRFYLEIPDPNFSPERNKAVIEGTIQKYNAMRKKKAKEYTSDYAERADAVVSYLRFAEKKPGYRMDHFFEPKYIAFLRGDEIRRKLMANMTILDNNGKDVTKHYI